jgi:hypothetical protein
LNNRHWVAHIDDERDIGNGIIVTLEKGWEFNADKGCGVRGFDTVAEVKAGTNRSSVTQECIHLPFRHNAPLNPEFSGAQPARVGEDY